MANELHYGDRFYLQNLYQGDGGTSTSTAAPAVPGGSLEWPPRRSPTGCRAAAPGRSPPGPARPPAHRSRAATSSTCATSTRATAATSTSTAPPPPPRSRPHGLYDVTTAWGKDRDGNSSRWQIFDQTTSPLDGLVRFNDTVLLWSTYKNLGGFLDVSYASPLPAARLDVDTNAYANRSNSNVTFWKILPTT